jgi:hypothetical protein
VEGDGGYLMGLKRTNGYYKTVFIALIVVVSIIGIISTGISNITSVYASNPPDSPSDLTAVAISSTKVILKWHDNSDNEINFVIERRTGKSSYFPLTIIGSNKTSYMDYGLNPDAVYYYRIKAHGSAGDSSYSNVIAVNSLPSAMPAPVLLSPFNSAIVNTLTPLMKWVPSTQDVTYNLQIAKDMDFSQLVVDKKWISDPYYEVPSSTLKWAYFYYWRVRSQDSSGNYSDWSPRAYFRLFPQSFGQFSCNCH